MKIKKLVSSTLGCGVYCYATSLWVLLEIGLSLKKCVTPAVNITVYRASLWFGGFSVSLYYITYFSSSAFLSPQRDNIPKVFCKSKYFLLLVEVWNQTDVEWKQTLSIFADFLWWSVSIRMSKIPTYTK